MNRVLTLLWIAFRLTLAMAVMNRGEQFLYQGF